MNFSDKDFVATCDVSTLSNRQLEEVLTTLRGSAPTSKDRKNKTSLLTAIAEYRNINVAMAEFAPAAEEDALLEPVDIAPASAAAAAPLMLADAAPAEEEAEEDDDASSTTSSSSSSSSSEDGEEEDDGSDSDSVDSFNVSRDKPVSYATFREMAEEFRVDDHKMREEISMLKQQLADALARVPAPPNVIITKPKAATASGRVSTKGADMNAMLHDGEIVYAKELINDGDDAGAYRVMTATWNSTRKHFNEYEVSSPTTLCSRFRTVMKEAGQCKKGSSTCCGFAKCYVIRDGKEVRLASLISQ